MDRRAGLLSLLTFVAACSQASPAPGKPPAGIVERAYVAMGSELRLTAWTADEQTAIAAFNASFAEFERLDALMSIWRAGSDIQRLNAAAGRQPVAVSSEVREVLRTAEQVSEWTRGKFDVTFAALSDIWRFDHDQDGRVPDAREIASRLPLIDHTSLHVDDKAGTAFLSRPGMRVHLGGIGKGYAIDRAAALLRSRGLTNFMIQAGGDLYVAGRRGDRPWRAAIRDPRGPEGKMFAALDLTDETFSTSGDYERAFIKDGRRYHHILDPDTGQPARLARSVTIVSARAILADAVSTGVFLVGPQEGMSLIERLPQLEGVIVTAGNVVMVSSGLRGRLALLAPPTDAP